MKKNYILLYLITIFSIYSSLFSMEEPPQHWVFIQNVPGAADKEDPDVDWRIKNGKLELNLNATEVMTQQTFADLIKEAQDPNKPLPFILIKVQSGDKGQFTHFFDGSMIASLLNTQLRSHFSHMQNPVNNQPVTNIEIYVMGDNGKLSLLKSNIKKAADLYFLVTFENIMKNIGGRLVPVRDYKLVKELQIPGVAQAFIARVYRDQSSKMIEEAVHEDDFTKLMEKVERLGQLEKEENNLRTQLAELKNKRDMSSTKSENLDKEITNIELKIDNIVEEIKLLKEADPEIEKLLQLERLWLSWSLNKFGPQNDFQKQAAMDRMNEIENKPQYIQD